MSYINFLRHTFVDTGSMNTPEGAIIRTGGKIFEKTITLSASNATDVIDVCEFTGVIEILALTAEVMVVNTLNNCTNVHFLISDGTTNIVLSKATGANINGFGTGSFLIKEGNASVELSVADSNTITMIEGTTGGKAKTPFILVANKGASNYIQFKYTTTDTPIDAELKVIITWADINSGVLI
jgi:hypothetical protein